jgi:hypothetical protein
VEDSCGDVGLEAWQVSLSVKDSYNLITVYRFG